MPASKTVTSSFLQSHSVEGCDDCGRYQRITAGAIKAAATALGGELEPLDLFVDNLMTLVEDGVELADYTSKHKVLILIDKQTADVTADFGIAKSNLIQASKAHAAGSPDLSLLLTIGKSHDALHSCSAHLVELGNGRTDALSGSPTIHKLPASPGSLAARPMKIEVFARLPDERRAAKRTISEFLPEDTLSAIAKVSNRAFIQK
jgi:hypothetical protein